MGFLLKAGFWFGVVLLFLPKHPGALQTQRDAAQVSAQSLIDVAEQAAQFCKDQPSICNAASETSKLATSYLNTAADELNSKALKPNPNSRHHQ
ncbi:MAG: hypothetical protein COA47_06985 [Robiginitomaculum sp.]|nr:MAG: hypothetical protein COA47_06985 [Robiginitomaculum sp.]